MRFSVVVPLTVQIDRRDNRYPLPATVAKFINNPSRKKLTFNNKNSVIGLLVQSEFHCSSIKTTLFK